MRSDQSSSLPFIRHREVSRENMESLNRLSPGTSVVSLERYMATSLGEEVSPRASRKVPDVSSVIQGYLNLPDCAEDYAIELNDGFEHESNPRFTAAVSRGYSRAGSVSSFNSGRSLYNYGSIHSADSHGSRRGRKQWKCINRHRRSSENRRESNNFARPHGDSPQAERSTQHLLSREHFDSLINQKRLGYHLAKLEKSSYSSSCNNTTTCLVDSPGIF